MLGILLKKTSKKINRDPIKTLKLVQEILKTFIDTGDKNIVNVFLDQPENDQVADILTRERGELNDTSILSVFRKAKELERKKI